MKNRFGQAAIALSALLLSACGQNYEEDLAGNWRCSMSATEDGITMTMDLDVNYASNGSSTTMGTVSISPVGANIRYDVDLLVKGKWKVLKDARLEETGSDVSVIAVTSGGRPVDAATQREITNLMNNLAGTTSTSRIEKLDERTLILSVDSQLLSCRSS